MKKILHAIIYLYQLCVSPLLGCNCRFTPSCSEYCHHAIDTHGVIRGSWLAMKRLLRCHPFSTPSFDPVPQKNN